MAPAHFEQRKHSAPNNILFVHGNLASKYWWYPTVDILSSSFISQQTEVTLPGSMYMGELRGCGRSMIPTSQKLSIDDILADFISYTEKEGLKDVTVVGHSAGGLIAALLLARRPDLFNGALLVSPVGPEGLKNVPVDIADRYKAMEQSPELAAQIVGATVYQNNPDNLLFKNEIMSDVMHSLKTAGVQLVEALIGVDYREEVAQIQKPLRVFYGAHDWVLDESNAMAYKELVAHCVYEKLADHGHCLNFENPERMAHEVKTFIEGHIS